MSLQNLHGHWFALQRKHSNPNRKYRSDSDFSFEVMIGWNNYHVSHVMDGKKIRTSKHRTGYVIKSNLCYFVWETYSSFSMIFPNNSFTLHLEQMKLYTIWSLPEIHEQNVRYRYILGSMLDTNKKATINFDVQKIELYDNNQHHSHRWYANP